MGIYVEKAEKLFKESGWNCAQSVFVAFTDVTKMDERTALRVSASFGGGMGRMREVCGAVSGALMVLGAVFAPLDPTDRAAKAAHYALVQEFARRFREKNGSIICRELLAQPSDTNPVPEARTQQYYQKRPCALLVRDAAEIVEDLLAERSVL